MATSAGEVDPSAAGTREQFALCLRELRTASGRSFTQVASASARAPHEEWNISRATAHNLTDAERAAGGVDLKRDVLQGFLYGCGLTEPAQRERWLVRYDELYGPPVAAPVADEAVCPYRGLEAFTTADAVWFHGRQDAIDLVLAAVDDRHRAVLLLGPSGAGKSSLVQAGVLPAVAAGRLPGSDRWITVLARPGRDLFAELDAAGLPGARRGSLRSALSRRLAEQPGHRLLLVIDQFEELLTPLGDDDAEQGRQEAIDELTAVIGAAGVTVLLTMRNDFYPQLAVQAPDLLAVLTPGLVNLPAALTQDQLREIITGPAVTAKLRWEAGLPEQIVTDVLADSGHGRSAPVTVLPLLELALEQLWQRCEHNRLTHDAYRRVGGVRGALTAWCDAAIEQLSAGDRMIAERVLTALVRPADPDRNVPAVRQQLSLSSLRELTSPADPGTVDHDADRAVDRVVDTLARHRILTTRALPHAEDDRPDAVGEPVAELVHDAVIRDWPVLRDWVSRDHRFQDWLRRADERHRRWQLTDSADDLLTGSDLAEGIDWHNRRRLPRRVVEFLQASRRHQQARSRRTRRFNVGLAIALTVVVIVAAVAGWQWRTAVDAQRIALSRQLAAQSGPLMVSDPDLAGLLAIQAYRASPTAEATASLYAAEIRPTVRTLTGHAGRVIAVAFSPDGRHVASAGDDGTVRVWDLGTRQARTLTGHTGPVYAVAFSPDGHSLASGGDDGTVRVWDLGNGHARTLTTRTDSVGAVAYSPDGHSLASGGVDGELQVWDLVAGKVRALIGDNPSPILAVAFSPDGHSLASGSGSGGSDILDASTNYDGRLRLWDLGTGQARTFLRDTGPVDAVAFSPDGLSVAGTTSRPVLSFTGGADNGTVQLWNVRTGQQERTFFGTDTSRVYAVAFSNDGYLLASAGGQDDGHLRVWDLGTGQARTLFGHTGPVYGVAFSPDGYSLASVGEDGIVRVWDLGTGQTRVLTGHTRPINEVAFSPDGRRLASASDDGTVRVWNPGTGGSRALTGNTDATDAPAAVAFSPDGKKIASPTKFGGGTVLVWDVATGQSRTLTGNTAPPGTTVSTVGTVAFSPDGQSIASPSYDGAIPVWDLRTGRARTLTGHTDTVRAVAFSLDGQSLASASKDGTVRMWDLRTEQSRVLLNWIGPTTAAAFSPDGHTLASGGDDGTVRVWDLDNGHVRTLTGNTKFVWAVAFSPDGQSLASAGENGAVRVWDLGSGDARTLTGHADSVRVVAYSPDGLSLVSAGTDRTVHLWGSASATPTAAILRICGNVSRDLTRQERARYLPSSSSSGPTCHRQ